MIFGERSSGCPETAPACSGDPLDSIGTTSIRTWPISDFGEIQGRRLVVAIFRTLPGWFPSSVPSSLRKVAAVAVVVVVTSSPFRIVAVAVVVLTAHCDVTANSEKIPDSWLLVSSKSHF